MTQQLLATGLIRTVLGDVGPRSLGPTNYHEHLFQVSPLLPGDELDDEEKSSQEAGLLQASGFTAMVDATPLGLGHNPEGIARISAERNLSVIATTGRHREEHYGGDHWVRNLSDDTLAEAFVRDLTTGMPINEGAHLLNTAHSPEGNPVRAGILKAGIGYWSISTFEHQTLDALSVAHHNTGAPVMIHLELGTAAHEVLDLLEKSSVEPSSVALAHMDRNLDPGLHASLAERGAYLGYDGMARAKSHSDHSLLELTRLVVEKVGADKILLGGDVARASRYVAYGGMPGIQYLGERYVPRLREILGDEAMSLILVTNPAQWLTWKERP
jgi:5-phospho-D-xylono-1,4-lactonase